MSERPRALLILLCVSIPSFMINLDANIVAVSLASISRSLHADLTDVEWVISAYTLTFATLLLPAGALADRYGRKRMLICGLAIFTFASWICGAAASAIVLDLARAAQGVGAALQLSAALAILSHSFRGPDRARAFAFWGSVIGVAVSLGPVIGGVITHWFGWQWAFYVNVPVGVLLIGLAVAVLEESSDPEAGRLDLLGFATFSGSLLLATLGLIGANRHGWSDDRILAQLFGSLVLLAAFIFVEQRQMRPMVELGFFRRRTYLGANIAGLCFAATLLTMLQYIPLFLQAGLGFRPQIAGLLMLPMALPLFVVPRIVSGVLVHRLSGRALLSGGLVLVGCGFAWMSEVVWQFSYASLVGGMLLAGVGAGILNGETAKVSMAVIPPERAGMASGIGGTVRFSGIVLGFSLFGTALFFRISAELGRQMSSGSSATLARHLSAGEMPRQGSALHAIALQSYGSGYAFMFAIAAAAAFIGAALSWLLISSEETAPSKHQSASEPLAAFD